MKHKLGLTEAYRYALMLLLATFFSLTVSAQNFAVKGIVLGNGEALIGASVVETGTTNGTITDVDGNFTLDVKKGARLEISYVGYQPQFVVVGDQKQLSITLLEDASLLDEVVAIGYGVQKKKLNTGATIQVKGDEIQKQNATNPLHALQGKTPGVQITSESGQPGKNLKVTIRGAGSIYGNNPIYIVDGMQTGDISYLNSSDIESIDVLKDAASAAIYGAQASNGVVLVTTKTGKVGKAQVTLDAYYGIQNVAKKIGMLNAGEYATIINEGRLNDGLRPLYTDKAAFLSQYADTDWQDEVFRSNAPMYDVNLGVSGGTGQSTYSLSLGVTSQDGIVGNQESSSYRRYNFRTNSEHKLYKDIVTMGEHLTFSYINSAGVGEGGIYSSSPVRAALSTTPFLPMYDDAGNYLNNTNGVGVMYNGTEWVPWLESEYNPYAEMVTRRSASQTSKLVGDVYLQVEPIKGLKLKTLFGLDLYSGGSRSYVPVYQLSKYQYNNIDYAEQRLNKGYTWSWDNTISYDFKVQNHNIGILAGMSMREFQGEDMWIKNSQLVISDWEHAWIDNALNKDYSNSSLTNFSGKPSDESKMMSFFGRINYDYKEKYLLNATFRADGSSRFSKGNRWGYFPSVSAGWVVTNEDFMEDVSTLDFLKVRASWGQVGNQNIDAYQYMALIKTSNTLYPFGEVTGEGTLTSAGATANSNGAFASQLANLGLKWETSEQLDLGVDLHLLKNRLNLNFDLYNKTTRDWLVKAPVLATAGAEAPYINGGNVRNRGVELAVAWNDRVGKFNYHVSVNGAYNQNEVTSIADGVEYIAGVTNMLYNNSAAAYRQAEVGFPIGYFWGYQTNGILQNQTEVNEYVASLKNDKNNTLQGTGIAAGDVRFVDVNEDGKIDENDKTMIGSPHPDFTFGFSFGCDWKGFDFSLSANGVAGNELLQSYHNYAGDNHSNYTTEILGRWHGEGTSNTIPRVTDGKYMANYLVSDLFVKDGSFLRISNIQVGYDFATLIKSKYVSQLRLYVAVNNAYTFTSYTGYDPEVGYGVDSSTSGIDVGFYPRPRTFMTGVNIKF